LNIPKIVVDADIFLDHLRGTREPSFLRLALQRFFCYTTVFQAIELFSHGRNERELRAIEDSMASVKILGLNPKNARLYGTLLAKKKNVMRTLAAGLCREGRLPLLTGRPGEYRGYGIQLVPVRLVARYTTGQEILGAIARTGSPVR
jgi:predicted nucleic acid-binding protein